MERSRPEPTTKFRAAALTALALLGPLFGIATQVWGQALMLLGLALLLIFAPPRRSPGALWCVLFLAIFALGLTAFLPARWFAIPEWRRALTADFRVTLPGTLSPQPWVSLNAVCLMFSGLVFALYLITHPWGPQARRQAMRWYAGGIVMLAVLAFVVLEAGWRVPFWPEVLNSLNNFGIFPNRNQTANVFALAGILAMALAFDSFQRKRKGGWFWIVSVIVLGAGLIQTFSRAGILIFFGGIAAWVLLSFALSKSRKGGALAIAGIALLLAGFFIFGGGTFERFQGTGGGGRKEYRIGIQKDALHLAASAPWLGQGLGNFAPVFAMAREVSADQNRAIHPESDWLWITVEMGWPATVLFATGFLLWLRQCLPLSSGSDRALRSAAMVCGLAFALHSFADVSGHRPGSAWPSLFIACLAMHPKRIIAQSRLASPVFRLFGVMLALISAWWFASIFSESIGKAAPTYATAARLAKRVEQENREKDFAAAVVDVNEALRIMPLNADLYFQRGIAHVIEGFSVWGAAWDFGTARFLEPRWAELCFSEGKAWTESRHPDLALDAWAEALRRAGDKGPALYDQMLYWVHEHPGMHAGLAKFAQTNPDYFLVFLRHSDGLECDLQIGRLLDAEPKLVPFSPAQKRALFSIWFRQSDHQLLFPKLLANPEWQKDGWQWLALLYAEAKDYRSACRIARKSSPRPVMPDVTATKPLLELERIFRFRPDDFQDGLQLQSAQLADGKPRDALATLRALDAIPGHPAYLAFMEAGLLEALDEWEQAWKAWLRFAEAEFR
jgi:O-antigen ligase/tetratricopeptide (TPR) repeat protein